MANWEKKSAYLLKEIVKFKTYVDSLNEAQAAKEKVYAARRARGEDVPEPLSGSNKDANAGPPAVKVAFDNPFPLQDEQQHEVPAMTTVASA